MKILSYADLRSERGIQFSKVHLWRLEDTSENFRNVYRWVRPATVGWTPKLTIG